MLYLIFVFIILKVYGNPRGGYHQYFPHYLTATPEPEASPAPERSAQFNSYLPYFHAQKHQQHHQEQQQQQQQHQQQQHCQVQITYQVQEQHSNLLIYCSSKISNSASSSTIRYRSLIQCKSNTVIYRYTVAASSAKAPAAAPPVQITLPSPRAAL